jgi:hypothetical protein
MSRKSTSNLVLNDEVANYLLKSKFSVIRGAFYKPFKERDCTALLSLKVANSIEYYIQFTPSDLQGTVLENSQIQEKLLKYKNFEALTKEVFKEIEKLRQFLKNAQ